MARHKRILQNTPWVMWSLNELICYACRDILRTRSILLTTSITWVLFFYSLEGNHTISKNTLIPDNDICGLYRRRTNDPALIYVMYKHMLCTNRTRRGPNGDTSIPLFTCTLNSRTATATTWEPVQIKSSSPLFCVNLVLVSIWTPKTLSFHFCTLWSTSKLV